MKIKEYTLEVLKNLGNYENAKFSLTVTCDKGEEPNFGELRDMIEKQYYQLYIKPKEDAKKEAEKPKLVKDSELCRKIEARLKNKTATLKQVKDYYQVDNTIYLQWLMDGITEEEL